MKILSWLLRIVAAIILLQTLYFKFSAHPDSVYIFSEIGLEPYGRIGSGMAELIVGIILLFMSNYIWLGALGAMGVMTGAIFFHLTSLGIAIHNDGGTLFYMAVVVWLAGLVLLILHKNQIPLAMSQKK